jgi:hypothetical protein
LIRGNLLDSTCFEATWLLFFVFFFLKKGARAGEQTRDLLILFIFSFHHFTAEPQRLP